jgi:hypothetical protein
MKIDLTKIGVPLEIVEKEENIHPDLYKGLDKLASSFFQKVDGIARELLGRTYKKHLTKGDLTKQAEDKIKACLTRKHMELFGVEFLQRWVKIYLYYYYADVYQARYAADMDSWNSDIYCNAFFGQLFKELT